MHSGRNESSKHNYGIRDITNESIRMFLKVESGLEDGWERGNLAKCSTPSPTHVHVLEECKTLLGRSPCGTCIAKDLMVSGRIELHVHVYGQNSVFTTRERPCPN